MKWLARQRKWGFLYVVKRHQPNSGPINWDRAAAICGYSRPPKVVYEQQFDGFDQELRRLAQTPYEQVDFSDLWYYYLDLAYVELQPDLFAYLFPACLMDWHQSLSRNDTCSHGDSCFHYGIHRGQVFEKMLTAEQRVDVFAFFRDSFLERLDGEQEFEPLWQDADFGWLHRFNSVGLVMPQIDMLWTPWWKAETPGRALCLLKYCSSFIYFDRDNPLFDSRTPKHWGAVPTLWLNDSMIYDTGWLEPNIEFLHRTLTPNYVLRSIDHAAEQLDGTPGEHLAWRIAGDAVINKELLASRIEELPNRLCGGRGNDSWSWSV